MKIYKKRKKKMYLFIIIINFYFYLVRQYRKTSFRKSKPNSDTKYLRFTTNKFF